jgi:tetratricopeptide (TPR) repeat protein
VIISVGHSSHLAMSVATTVIENPIETLSSKRRLPRLTETFRLIWLDSKFDETNEDTSQLAKVFDSIEKFLDPDPCVDFLTNIKLQKVLMIISHVFGAQIVPLIHDIPQLDSIFVFCCETIDDQSWSNDYRKVKGFSTEMSSIYDLLMRHTRLCDEDFVSISMIPSSINYKLDELDPSFMYSRLLRETILERMEFDNEQAKHDLVDFYRSQNDIDNRLIEEFDREYDHHSSIWWYTKESFIYSNLNRALRTQDVEVIIKLGFFIKKLHQQIEEIHCNHSLPTTITVYRGQVMCSIEFEKLKQNQGGLISFNSFLSTSLDQQVSYAFADSIRFSTDNNLVGILFQMEIDPLLTTSYPFAALDNISYFLDQEKEILFSMHTVFRIVKIEEIEERLWQINLILTNEHDEQLRRLTDHIRKEIFQPKGWFQFGQLIYRMGLYHQALQLYQTLLRSTNIENYNALAFIHHQLGFIYAEQQQQFDKALNHLQISLQIELSYGQENDDCIATIHNNIAGINYRLNHFDTALEYFQLSLDINLNHMLTFDPELIAINYNNIAMIYQKKREYQKALENHQYSLDLKLIYLPPSHPTLAITYTNLGDLHYQMKDYPSALDYHQKALEIQQRALPSTHVALALTHHGLAKTFDKLNQNSDAILHASQALQISQHARDCIDGLQLIHYQAELDRLCNKENDSFEGYIWSD